MYGEKNYLFLKTEKPLSKREKDFLFYILENCYKYNILLPKKFYVNSKLEEKKLFVLKKENDFFYCIPIIRKLSNTESKEIYDKLKLFFNFKFKIMFDKDNNVKKDQFLDNISKIIYNEFVNEKIQNGWKFGLIYDKKNKISPRIVTWDNLNKNQKQKFKKKINIIYNVIKSNFANFKN